MDESVPLLDAVSRVTAELALDLLREAGIPACLRGPDFDVAELGVFAHDTLRGVNVHVSMRSLQEACAVLDEAWGEGWRATEASLWVRRGAAPSELALQSTAVATDSTGRRVPWFAFLTMEGLLRALLYPLLDFVFGRVKKDREP